MPEISKTHPIPPEKPPRKKIKQEPSPWVDFLRKLEVGDSFMCAYWELGTIQRYMKQLGYGCRHEKDRIKGGQRVWRV